MAGRRTFVVWLLAVVLAAGGVDAFRASMKAMACCARAHHTCAGLDTPDDCCQRMGHTSPSAPSLQPSARDVAPASASVVAILPVWSFTVIPSSRASLVDPTFKRPHDPPHLHPIPLLI